VGACMRYGGGLGGKCGLPKSRNDVYVNNQCV